MGLTKLGITSRKIKNTWLINQQKEKMPYGNRTPEKKIQNYNGKWKYNATDKS